MKLTTYLKEKIGVIFGTIFLVIAIYMIGYVFKASSEYMNALVLLVLVINLIMLASEYIRKRRFYKDFCDTLDGLDQKYLITDMMLKPTFQEGRLMLDALYEIDKSMKDRLNDMEMTVTDFKEYLELWIHEIKIPISSLNLMNYNENTDLVKQRAQIKRLSAMVEQILFYARADAPEKDYLLNACKLEAVINKAVVEQKDLLIGNKIAIEKEDVGVSVITDSKWLEFILGQIINNSIKYVDNAKTDKHYIRFFTQESDREIVFVIEDNGIGISEKDIDRVFDRTFTGENGRKGNVSTGMGLYICKKLCDKLGHIIEAESQNGEYTRIMIRFGKNTFYSM